MLGVAIAIVTVGLPASSTAGEPESLLVNRVAEADCGPGSRPETGVQGQVPKVDRDSGRNKLGYWCNLVRLGGYQGEGAAWVNPSYDTCAYMATAFLGTLGKRSQGTQVVDVSDPRNPRLSTNLTSPAMFTSPWESLKVNEKRGLLAGVSGGGALGALFFDVYDISQDCARPRILNGANGTNLTMPANVLGHEGEWAPDGNTYYASGVVGGSFTAIDVSDPTKPRMIFTGLAGIPANHGFSLSADGNRLYMTRAAPPGVDIFDVSAIQNREPAPAINQIGSVSWSDGLFTQHTIPITYQGKPYLVAVDEFNNGGVRFIDISDERNPKVTHQLKLGINAPEHAAERIEDTVGNGLFGYEAHYCSVDRADEPRKLACGWFQSGVRVFDIRDLSQVKEIAYYNPPAQSDNKAKLKGSEHAYGIGAPIGGGLTGSNLTADWCSSPPRFAGSDQLWVTCQDNGFLALQLTNGAQG
ncbi:LVIVD repeat-containing protein [Saccharopolyspora elongata]|uniref:LVIVD repeat-containing protein n=1 Tax=Saccharopolyspora elongata TaxID=2530387 RepID=UPI001404D8A9|nr:hypothetical protein [Saccharopolyspora elongata]